MKVCKLHPKYKGTRKPTSKKNGCICREVYDYMNKKTPNFISGVMRSPNDYRKGGREAARNLIKNFKDYKHEN